MPAERDAVALVAPPSTGRLTPGAGRFALINPGAALRGSPDLQLDRELAAFLPRPQPSVSPRLPPTAAAEPAAPTHAHTPPPAAETERSSGSLRGRIAPSLSFRRGVLAGLAADPGPDSSASSASPAGSPLPGAGNPPSARAALNAKADAAAAASFGTGTARHSFIRSYRRSFRRGRLSGSATDYESGGEDRDRVAPAPAPLTPEELYPEHAVLKHEEPASGDLPGGMRRDFAVIVPPGSSAVVTVGVRSGAVDVFASRVARAPGEGAHEWSLHVEAPGEGAAAPPGPMRLVVPPAASGPAAERDHPLFFCARRPRPRARPARPAIGAHLPRAGSAGGGPGQLLRYEVRAFAAPQVAVELGRRADVELPLDPKAARYFVCGNPSHHADFSRPVLISLSRPEGALPAGWSLAVYASDFDPYPDDSIALFEASANGSPIMLPKAGAFVSLPSGTSPPGPRSPLSPSAESGSPRSGTPRLPAIDPPSGASPTAGASASRGRFLPRSKTMPRPQVSPLVAGGDGGGSSPPPALSLQRAAGGDRVRDSLAPARSSPAAVEREAANGRPGPAAEGAPEAGRGARSTRPLPPLRRSVTFAVRPSTAAPAAASPSLALN
eukprot:tig00000754_g3901.t1